MDRERHCSVSPLSPGDAHTERTRKETDMLLQALCKRQTGGHTVTALKTRITEKRHPGSRISQAKAQRRELVMCGIGKRAG